MARKLRIFVPFGYYHVYARVTRGEMIFADRTLSRHWVRTIERVAGEFAKKVPGFSFVANATWHLLSPSFANATNEKPGTFLYLLKVVFESLLL